MLLALYCYFQTVLAPFVIENASVGVSHPQVRPSLWLFNYCIASGCLVLGLHVCPAGGLNEE